MRTAIAVFALLTLASAAAAQGQPSPACRAVAAVDDATVEFQRELFHSDDVDEDSVYTKLRAHFGIRQLGASDPAVAVRDPAVCEAWLPAITAALRLRYGPDHDADGYLFQMVQYGPYMLVIGDTDPDLVPPGVSLGGSLIPLLIFEAAGKRYLGGILG